MSKIKQYIEDAVNQTASNIKTKGVEIKDVTINAGAEVNIDNGDLALVLLELAKSQAVIAKAVIEINNSKPKIETNPVGLSIRGVDNSPIAFEKE